MSYPWVPAPDHWPRQTPIRAIAIHHAEGGGTVSWLTRPDGNSSHYVVEYTGRIVQMVKENRAAGSIDPSKVRTTDDPPFTYLGESITYGVTANKAALGDAWKNPNSAVIAIEVEGFARVGPNAAQRGSLRSLVKDIRSRHGNLPALGHRDFQNYKPCPGKLIPWIDYGGHGIAEEEQLRSFTYTDEAASGWYTVSGDDHLYLRLRTNTLHPIGDGVRKRAFGPVTLTDGGITGPADPRKVGYVINGEAAFMLNTDGVFLGDAPPAVVPDVVLSPGQLFTVGAK
jgi:hypothetical protein